MKFGIDEMKRGYEDSALRLDGGRAPKRTRMLPETTRDKQRRARQEWNGKEARGGTEEADEPGNTTRNRIWDWITDRLQERKRKRQAGRDDPPSADEDGDTPENKDSDTGNRSWKTREPKSKKKRHADPRPKARQTYWMNLRDVKRCWGKRSQNI